MKSLTVKTIAAGALALGLGLVGMSPASAATTIGDLTPDAQGQSVYMGSVQCTMTAGNPVTVTINGVRNIQSTNSLSCNAPVTVAGLASLAARYGETVQTARYRKVVTTNFYNRTSVSVSVTGPCIGAANTSWAGLGEMQLDMNRDGVIDALVKDASFFNLRSCTG